MKVALINHSFPPIIGGGQTYLYYLAKYLPSYNIEADVITGTLPDNYRNLDVPSIPGNILRLDGFKDYSKGKGDLKDFIPSFVSAICKVNPDIIYAHGYMSCICACLIRNVFPSMKIVFIYHSTPIPQDGKFAGCLKIRKLMNLLLTLYLVNVIMTYL